MAWAHQKRDGPGLLVEKFGKGICETLQQDIGVLKRNMIIGLTGSFGTGKSFVASIFELLGATIIDADTIARKELRKSSPSYKRIVASFAGDGILGEGREIDRRKLAALAFGQRSKLEL